MYKRIFPPNNNMAGSDKILYEKGWPLRTVTLACCLCLCVGLSGFGAGDVLPALLLLVMAVLLVLWLRRAPPDRALFAGRNAVLLPAMLCYCAVDILNFWLGEHFALAWQKHRVAGALLLLFVCICVVCAAQRDFLWRLLLWVGLSFIIIGGATLVRYFLMRDLPLYYSLRFSLRSDYNMYATALYCGFVCLFFYLLARGAPPVRLLAPLLFAVALPLLVLTASRRVLLLLPLTLVVMSAAYIVQFCRTVGLRGVRRTVAALSVLLLCLSLAAVSLTQLQAALQTLHRQQGAQRVTLGQGGAQTGALQRYRAQTTETSLLYKRRVIWGVALDELRGQSFYELVFGRSGGASIALYDTPRAAEALDAVYPDRDARAGALSAHSMFLADLLDGGVIKLFVLLFLLIVTAVCTLDMMFKTPWLGLPCGLILLLCVVNSAISNRFGLLYDRHFMIFSAAVAGYSLHMPYAEPKRRGLR